MIVSLLIFLLILGILIFVHELGHFIVAKLSGMRVDEFGIGFPPRLLAKRKGETTYCVNAIPFGGYVKIHGENPEAEGEDTDPRSFDNKPVFKRILVIVAGVAMNLIFPFIILTVAFSVGFVSIAQDLTQVPGAKVVHSDIVLTEITANGPADKAGLEVGDTIRSFSDSTTRQVTGINSVTDLQNYTRNHQATGVTDVTAHIERNGKPSDLVVQLNKTGLPLGVAADTLNTVRVPVWQAPKVALKEMGVIIKLTWDALVGFAKKLFAHGQLDQNVSGPIGIYQATASARQIGFSALLLLVVALSINLALLNILPIPALDGGKLLFLLIEGVFGKKAVSRRLEQQISAVCFVLLIGLILVLTVRDVIRLF